MKFGLSFLPDAAPSTKSPSDFYRDALDLSVIADQGGMATVKITEHYGRTYGGYCPDPLMFLTAVAQRTKNVRLMTGCILPVFHHPVQLASRIALADVLCGGRLDIGLARAFLPNEFAMFGIDINESQARFEAVTAALRDLFLSERANAATPFFTYRDAQLLPQPVQRPHPPFWGAAARSRSSFASIGASGMNLLTAFTIQPAEHLREQIAIYHESRADAGHAGPGAVTMLIPLFVHRDDRIARSRGAAYLEQYHSVWADAATAWRGVTSAAYPGYTDLDRQLRSVSVEDLFANGSLAFGDPARIRDYIAEIAEAFLVDQILWNVDFGGMPREDAFASVNLFLEECLSARVGRGD